MRKKKLRKNGQLIILIHSFVREVQQLSIKHLKVFLEFPQPNVTMFMLLSVNQIVYFLRVRQLQQEKRQHHVSKLQNYGTTNQQPEFSFKVILIYTEKYCWYTLKSKFNLTSVTLATRMVNSDFSILFRFI